MIIASVLSRVATRLATISSLTKRTTAYPPDALPGVPWAFPEWPSEVAYDQTMGRGMDRITLPVRVVVAPRAAVDRAAWASLSVYADGSGTSSVKAALETEDSATEFSTLEVTGASFGTIAVGGVEYYGASFDVTIYGSG